MKVTHIQRITLRHLFAILAVVSLSGCGKHEFDPATSVCVIISGGTESQRQLIVERAKKLLDRSSWHRFEVRDEENRTIVDLTPVGNPQLFALAFTNGLPFGRVVIDDWFTYRRKPSGMPHMLMFEDRIIEVAIGNAKTWREAWDEELEEASRDGWPRQRHAGEESPPVSPPD